MDNIIIAQEIVHSMKRKKGSTGWMVMKLDLEKAYDRLRWDFIDDTLSDIGFPNCIRRVIMNCISSAEMCIMWNGKFLKLSNPHGALGKATQFLRTFLCFVWRG